MAATEDIDYTEHLRQMVAVVDRLSSNGFSDLETRQMLDAALDHVAGNNALPYARGTCCTCGAVNVAWSPDQ